MIGLAVWLGRIREVVAWESIPNINSIYTKVIQSLPNKILKLNLKKLFWYIVMKFWCFGLHKSEQSGISVFSILKVTGSGSWISSATKKNGYPGTDPDPVDPEPQRLSYIASTYEKLAAIYNFCFFLSVFYYPIHVKTAEPIWSNFFCGNSHDPGEAVYVDIFYFWKFANSNGKIRKNVRRWPLSKQKLKVEIPKKNCAVCTLYVLYGNIAKAKSFWTITDFFVGLNLLPLARNRVISKGLLHTLLLIVIQP